MAKRFKKFLKLHEIFKTKSYITVICYKLLNMNQIVGNSGDLRTFSVIKICENHPVAVVTTLYNRQFFSSIFWIS